METTNNQFHIKLPKEFIKQHSSVKDKTISVLIYLFFHTTVEKYIYTSIDCICEELNMSTKSHGERRSQNIIKDILKEFENQKIITIQIDDIEKSNNNQLFKIYFNMESELLNPTSQYVYIDITEYQAIMKCEKYLNKVCNAFCYLKSYICMNNDCLHICYPSLKTICRDCGCSHKTIGQIMKRLHINQLLYVCHLDEEDMLLINKNVEYVFALSKYSKEEIMNEFKI